MTQTPQQNAKTIKETIVPLAPPTERSMVLPYDVPPTCVMTCPSPSSETKHSTAQMTMTTIPSTTPTREKATGSARIPVPMTAFTANLAVVQALSLVWMALADDTVWLFGAIVLFGATVGNILMLQPLLHLFRIVMKIFQQSENCCPFAIKSQVTL